jgi:phosphoribosyl 1,2-cyclic phosphodiesterase
MNYSLGLKFWGVRGSHPTAQREMLGFGGNTASVEIVTPHARLVFDAGTGIIPLGQAIVRGPHMPLVLLLSHWHHDHLQGLPFFAPLFRPNTQLTIAAPGDDEMDVAHKLHQVMSPPQFPVEWDTTRAAKRLIALPERSTLFVSPNGSVGFEPQRNAIRIRTFHSDAHPNGITLYRVEYRGAAIVYATDVESDAHHAAEIVEFARGADILIHDAQYQRAHYLGEPPFSISTHGFGHSTNEMASAIARAANVKQLVLFHHDPNYDDDTIARIQAQTRALFPNTITAREGMAIPLHAKRKEASHVAYNPLDAAAAPNL